MKKSNQAKYAYMAGLIDGEGCISSLIQVSNKDGFSTARVRLRIGQKDGRIIDWLFGNFGGRIGIHRDMRRDSNSSYMWESPEASRLYGILKRCLPFFVFKKRQAELAMQVIEIKATRKGSQRYSSSQWLRLNSLCDELTKLHSVYLTCAAVETKSTDPIIRDAIVRSETNVEVSE